MSRPIPRPSEMSLPLSRSPMFASASSDSWTSSWPDAAAFALGLAVARWAGWNTADLVWSLWLSSFVVGYSTIVWMIGQPAVTLAWLAWRDRGGVGAPSREIVVPLVVILGGPGFLLAVFTIHFGGFRYAHSPIFRAGFPGHVAGGRGGSGG